jgi:hypothetical protein
MKTKKFSLPHNIEKGLLIVLFVILLAVLEENFWNRINQSTLDFTTNNLCEFQCISSDLVQATTKCLMASAKNQWLESLLTPLVVLSCIHPICLELRAHKILWKIPKKEGKRVKVASAFLQQIKMTRWFTLKLNTDFMNMLPLNRGRNFMCYSLNTLLFKSTRVLQALALKNVLIRSKSNRNIWLHANMSKTLQVLIDKVVQCPNKHAIRAVQ